MLDVQRVRNANEKKLNRQDGRAWRPCRAHLSAAWRCQCEAPEKAKPKAQRIHFLSAISRANHSHFLRTSRSGDKSAGRGRPALPALPLPIQKSTLINLSIKLKVAGASRSRPSTERLAPSISNPNRTYASSASVIRNSVNPHKPPAHPPSPLTSIS